MRIDMIENYLIDLRNMLIKHGVSKQFARKIIESVKIRIYSIVLHWNDVDFRKAVLIIGLEEGSFYDPLTVNSDLKSFVVVAIRNSLIEIPQSDDYAIAGLSKKLNNEFVKKITRDAINHFIDFNFEQESLNCGNLSDDYYGDTTSKFPLAWKILKLFSSQNQNPIIFESIKTLRVISVDQDSNTRNNEIKNLSKPIVENGMNPNINNELRNILTMIDVNKSDCFYVDSFKMATRNFEKLMYILEFVLSRNKIFCTNNYYISNSYIEKREPIIRPAHSLNDFKENMRNFKGTQEKHKKLLQDISSALR